MTTENCFPHRRIVVVGTTGSGKSTMAERLANKISGEFIELDALHWEPNWMEAPLDVFRSRVTMATQAQAWVVAGNYHVVRDLVWECAEAIVFWRLTTRTIKRAVTQEELWNGNRERFWWHFKLWSDDSLFKWLFKTYWRRKREYPQLFALPEHEHLKVIHFRTPQETEEWMTSIRINDQAYEKAEQKG